MHLLRATVISHGDAVQRITIYHVRTRFFLSFIFGSDRLGLMRSCRSNVSSRKQWGLALEPDDAAYINKERFFFSSCSVSHLVHMATARHIFLKVYHKQTSVFQYIQPHQHFPEAYTITWLTVNTKETHTNQNRMYSKRPARTAWKLCAP